MEYEIRDDSGKVLRRCYSLREAVLRLLDYPDDSVIVEKWFMDGEWKEREMYVGPCDLERGRWRKEQFTSPEGGD